MNAVFWIIAIMAFLLIEASTAVLVSIWFAGGALVALIASLFGAGAKVQIFLFLLVSVLCIALLRKIAIKNVHGAKRQTNLDGIIGKQVVITEAVDGKNLKGSTKINDVEWKVKSENGEDIEVGEVVTVTDIEGVKLIVKK